MSAYKVTAPTGEVFTFNNTEDYEAFLRKNGLWPSELDEDEDDTIPDWYGDDPIEHLGDMDPLDYYD